MVADVEKHVTTCSNLKNKRIVSSTEMQHPEFSVTFPQRGRYMQAVYIHRMVAVERNANSRFCLLPHNSSRILHKTLCNQEGLSSYEKVSCEINRYAEPAEL